MPNNVIISEGSTTNDAIEKGLKILNVSRNMVNIRVLENEDKRSFFRILSPRVVKVELSLKEQKSENDREKVIKEKKPVSIEKIEKAEENVREFLNQFLNKISSEITFKIDKNEYGLDISIDGDASTMLIGYRGETMYAMQNIISSIVATSTYFLFIILVHKYCTPSSRAWIARACSISINSYFFHILPLPSF